MKLTRSNPKALETISVNLQSLASVQGKVGWFETSKYPDGTPVAYVAALNELGHGKTPPRPTMRPTAIEQRNAWTELAGYLATQVLQGKITGYQAMDTLTLQAEGDVGKTLAEITTPELSPITIELRYMKKKNPGLVVTAATVGQAAARVAQPGYVTPDVSVKPLNDTGLEIATLTHIVETV